MKYRIIRPVDAMSAEGRSDYARMIVALATNDNFDEIQKDPTFNEIYDLATRYLDKELENGKEANWRKLEGLTKNL